MTFCGWTIVDSRLDGAIKVVSRAHSALCGVEGICKINSASRAERHSIRDHVRHEIEREEEKRIDCMFPMLFWIYLLYSFSYSPNVAASWVFVYLTFLFSCKIWWIFSLISLRRDDNPKLKNFTLPPPEFAITFLNWTLIHFFFFWERNFSIGEQTKLFLA